MIDKLDLEFVRDMLHYSETATRLLGSASASELIADQRGYLAVRHALLVAGEAASQVSKRGRAELPEIPWSQVTGMRHHLVHGYGQVRAEILVRSVREDLPGLIASLRRALGD